MKRRVLLAGALALLPATAFAHPYHTTSAVADVRGRTVEVTLTVTPEDLQEALRRSAGRTIDIDTAPEVDALTHAYTKSRFVLTHEDQPLALRWIGTEIEADTARLYFEFRLPKKARDITVRNSVFFELAPAQINRVLVREDGHRHTLRFSPRDPAPQRLRR